MNEFDLISWFSRDQTELLWMNFMEEDLKLIQLRRPPTFLSHSINLKTFEKELNEFALESLISVSRYFPCRSILNCENG